MRIVLILLFISFNAFSQTYDELMSITSVDMFKKVMIENSYQYDAKESDDTQLWYRTIDQSKAAVYADNMFIVSIGKTSIITGSEIKNEFDAIYNQVKSKCTFTKIKTLEIEYACYKCNDAQFKGTIGFAVVEGSGVISQIIAE